VIVGWAIPPKNNRTKIVSRAALAERTFPALCNYFLSTASPEVFVFSGTVRQLSFRPVFDLLGSRKRPVFANSVQVSDFVFYSVTVVQARLIRCLQLEHVLKRTRMFGVVFVH